MANGQLAIHPSTTGGVAHDIANHIQIHARDRTGGLFGVFDIGSVGSIVVLVHTITVIPSRSNRLQHIAEVTARPWIRGSQC